MRMNKKTLILGAVLATTSLPMLAFAGGNPSAGQAKAKTCEACHGPTGESIDPTYPNLAGQHASYMEKALKDYRSGKRTNPIMAPMAATLSDQDIEDIAAWYAKQDGLKDLSIK